MNAPAKPPIPNFATTATCAVALSLAVLQAALQGFPGPPTGKRRIVVQIPR